MYIFYSIKNNEIFLHDIYYLLLLFLLFYLLPIDIGRKHSLPSKNKNKGSNKIEKLSI